MKISNNGPTRRERPLRTLIYAPEGVGKTTFLAGAPSPFLIDTDGGSGRFNFNRFDEEPKTWSDVLDGLALLAAGEGEFETLEIDTLDGVEPMIWDHIVRQEAKATDINEGSYAYGRGVARAHEEWRRLLAELEKVQRNRGCEIVASCHSRVRTFNNPLGSDFDRYELNVHQSKSTDTAGLIKAWFDNVLFANFETLVTTEGDGIGEKTKGVHVSKEQPRWAYTERRAGFDAKSRSELPFKLDLSWEAYARARSSVTPETVIASIEGLIPLIDEGKVPAVRASIKKRKGDLNALIILLNNIKQATAKENN